jgi:protein-L-isoaspartate(D-aspartate) O-methyltransferase
LTKRSFLAGGVGFATAAPTLSWSATTTSHGLGASPPIDNREDFIAWMQNNRGEQPIFLARRWERFLSLRASGNLPDASNMRAFLLTPREEFVLKHDRERSYDPTFLNIGFGSTISGPEIVARMTGALDVKPGDKVLEIGTGSGYQSAYLANLTDQVWTIEIIKDLLQRTNYIYENLKQRGYSEYKSVTTKFDDGYNGWSETAPFDKIVVTCGTDHVPAPLLRQLKIGGNLVIPVGTSGAQHVLKITRSQRPDGSMYLQTTDVFAGHPVPFVPMRRLENV